MLRLRHKLVIHMLRVFDQVALFISLVLVAWLGPDLNGEGGAIRLGEGLHQGYALQDILGIFLLGFGFVLIFNRFVSYSADRLVSLLSQVLGLVCAATASAFCLMVIATLFSYSSISVLNVLVFWACIVSLGSLTRFLLGRLLTKARKSGNNSRYLLFIGHNRRALELASRIDASPELGFRIVGFISETVPADTVARGTATNSVDQSSEVVGTITPEKLQAWKVIGTLEDLRTILEKGTVDELMICLNLQHWFHVIANIVQDAHELGVVVRLIPEPGYANLLKQLQIEEFDGKNIVTLFREQMLLHLLAKRVTDIAVSLASLVLLSPVMLVAAVAIKLTSPGPVFFVQERVGMNKRRFPLYKFRSMVANAEQARAELGALNEMDGPVFKIRNDPRITPIGRLLRRTSIDELPQLFNVLRGQMSLVGPRPPLPNEVDEYEWMYRKRLSIKPGVTCIWQVRGRNNASFKQWMEWDREYIENWSLWLDLKILLQTIPVVLLCRGAS